MIEQIKEALEKATPGPWSLSCPHWYKGCAGRDCKQSVQANGGGTVATVFGAQYRDHANEDPRTEINSPNAELIANAPTYIRYLLDELDGLRVEHADMMCRFFQSPLHGDGE